MKRMLCAVLACAVVCCCALNAPARAAEAVYFTAVNDTIRELSDATMPFWANGILYVEGALFENRELSTGYFYNSGKRLAVVYERGTANHALYFSLADGTVTDASGASYSPGAILRHGTIFLPARLVSSTFGLSYTNTKVTRGYLTRIRSDKAVLSDQIFADAAVPRMESQYQLYQAALAAGQQDSESPAQPEPDANANKGQAVQLCFRADDAAATALLLEALDAAGAKGTFFFTADELSAAGELARRMVATGHAVGLAATEDGSDIADQLRRGNDALRRAAAAKTRLCFVSGEEAQQAAQAAGFVCFTPTIDRSAYPLKSASGGNYLFRLVAARKGRVKVWLGSGTESAGLRGFLRQAAAADDRLLSLTEAD